MKKLLTAAVATALTSPQLFAAGIDYNGKAMALSGAGVASANYSYGAQLNPANAVHFDESDDFNLNLNLGAVASDEDDLIDDGTDLADQLDALDTLDVTDGAQELGEIIDSLNSIDESQARIAAGFNLTVGIPNRHASAVFFANAVGGVQVQALVADQDIADIQAIIDEINSINAGNPPTVPAPEINVDNLQSRVAAVGVVMQEFGVALGREYTLGGQPIAFGITPKYQKIETIVYNEQISNFDDDNFDADNFTKEDSNMNLDLGVSTHWEHWYVGASLTNLVEEEYETVADGVTVEVETKATVGGSFKNGWGMASLDIDLNKTQDLTTLEEVQFVRFGAELDAWNWAQLRLGYRHDLEGNLDDTASLGFGLSPFGVVNLDLAVMAGENKTVGGAIQLGMSF